MICYQPAGVGKGVELIILKAVNQTHINWAFLSIATSDLCYIQQIWTQLPSNIDYPLGWNPKKYRWSLSHRFKNEWENFPWDLGWGGNSHGMTCAWNSIGWGPWEGIGCSWREIHCNERTEEAIESFCLLNIAAILLFELVFSKWLNKRVKFR